MNRLTVVPPGYDPLPQLLYINDFNRGFEGWTGLIGNYEDSLASMLPAYRDLRPPMLSSATVWDTGTSGALHGTYSLKLASRPQAGSMGVGIKRHTWRRSGRVRLETFFAVKPEAVRARLSADDVRAFGVAMDIQDETQRVMPHLRYLNALDGTPQRCWQFKSKREPLKEIGDSGETRSHFHLGPEGWVNLEDGYQELCYNELPTKQNWHYLRVGFDLQAMVFTELQCSDRTFDVSALEPMRMPAMPNLWSMLNVLFWVEADAGRRAYLYLDSVVLSGTEKMEQREG